MVESALGHVLLGIWIAGTFIALAWEVANSPHGLISGAHLQRTLDPTTADPRPRHLRYSWGEPVIRPWRAVRRGERRLRLVVRNPPRMTRDDPK
jgi:hypothetical protein